MRMSAKRFVLAGAGALVAVAVVGRDTPPGRALRRGIDIAARRMRYAEGRLEGLRYRLAGRQPDPTASDDVLADRIRSDLGGLEKRLDIPHVHVMVQDHVALLHGEVPTARDAEAIEQAVREVPGVRGIASHLHVGLGAGDTRPSAGRTERTRLPSPARRELLDAAREAGVPDELAPEALRAVLAGFAERLPADERAQLFAHVPTDVSELAIVPHRTGEIASPPRTVAELVGPIAAAAHLEPARAEAVTRAVLGHLRRLVPEEAEDVDAVLPHELRALWVAVAAAT